MPKKPKRDNAYYEAQLKHRFPAIHSDYRSGKYSSLREALITSGIKQPRSRLHELKNAWLKATAAEQREFLRWLNAQTAVMTGPSAPASGSGTTQVAVNRRLEAWATSRIRDIMNKRGLTIGDVMHEMGYKRLNASLGRALARRDQLQPDVISALERWLQANKSI
ncbi:hypothetical protein ASD50_03555 [Mesorhizobium sp. Root552]|uniref:hypothetical protein n=1 Tax=Mesorhizobium sp. Root552 TaxID=1736555 RepID=UPI0006FF9BEE|nr:hypothetical protein [Mesorhizobium sp. Root552]KQZ26496.1 hypothetical protein ASD50_03555 [Mesorhizobium sp. Root552]